MDYYIVIDNRLNPLLNYYEEARFATWQKQVTDLCIKLLQKSNSYSWLPPPTAFLYSNSPYSVNYIHLDRQEAFQLPSLFQARYSIQGGTTMPSSTWKQYLGDAIKKIKDSVNENKKVLITIYSTDCNLFGNRTHASAEDGIKAFVTDCMEMTQRLSSLTIKVVCCSILSTEDFENISLKSFQNEIISKRDVFTFDLMNPTPIVFEEQFKSLVGSLINIPVVKLLFPASEELDCTIFIHAVPHSFGSADCLPYLTQFECCSVCSRSKINPIYLAGFGLEIIPCSRDSNLNRKQ
jgi:hypothetical protein